MPVVYLDVCCLNRPFDDQAQARIHLESEAVLLILERLHSKTWDWVSSDVVDMEIKQTPDPERRQRVQLIAGQAHHIVRLDANIRRRANELAELGFSTYDALHIASSESANSDVLLTTDDQLLRLASRHTTLLLTTVANPLLWLQEYAE